MKNWKGKFLKALKEDEVFAAEVRALLLSVDLLTLPQKMTKIEKDIEILKNDVGMLKGSDRERWYRDRGYAIFGRLFQDGKPYDAQVARILWQALEKGIISEEERDDALEADLFWYGEIENRWVVLVGEVSFTINNKDVQRAKKRAEILRKAGIPAIPLVGGVEMEQGLKLDEIISVVDGKISKQEFKKLFEIFSIHIKKLDL